MYIPVITSRTNQPVFLFAMIHLHDNVLILSSTSILPSTKTLVKGQGLLTACLRFCPVKIAITIYKDEPQFR